MKKHLFTLLFAIVVSIVSLFASNISVDGIWYDLDNTNLTATVTYRGNSYNSFSNEYSGVVVIPNSFTYPNLFTYDDNIYTVTSIGNYAFYNCSGLTSVTIPNSITSIGYEAFESCSGLTSITIPEGVTSIGNYAFHNCSGLTSVTIPNSVTSIGYGAFGSCSGLTSVTIGNSVTSIGDRAFDECSGMTSVTIPNSVTSIGEDAFRGCSNLTSVTINTDAIIGKTYTSSSNISNIFGSQVTEYIIGNGVTSIGEYAFWDCHGLTSITIPESVTSIGNDAFAHCSGLTSITIPNSVTSIGSFAFFGCSGLTSVTIPESVTSIGSMAFADIPNIVYNGTAEGSLWGAKTINGYVDGYLVYSDDTKTTLTACFPTAQGDIVIPNSVTSIGSSAFSDCSGLTSITIPNSVTSIGNYAFQDCSGLTSVTIGNSVTSIGSSAFYKCSGLTSVTIGESVTSIGDYAFAYCSKLTSITIPNSVTSIGFSVFAKSGISNVVLSDSLTTIPASAFYYCANLRSVSLGQNLTSIAGSAFDNCTALETIVLPNSLTTIGSCAFRDCKNLAEINFPNSLTSIEYDAFVDCNSLTSITIPNSVTYMGSYVFGSCKNLNSAIVLSTNPPGGEGGINRSTRFPETCTVYVPTNSLQSYLNDSWWKDEYNIKPLCEYIQESTSSPTTFSIVFGYDDEDAQNIVSCGVAEGAEQIGNIVEYTGLEPNSEYANVPFVVNTLFNYSDTINISFTTSELELTTQPSKAVSSTTAILLAETNMSDAETSCGFEYKRNDAPEDMVGTKVYCPVASGQMAGRLKNLKDDVYYKYRAFYESAAGNMYYGDWQYIFTGDNAIEFDPILYTYAATAVSESQATLKGYALAGSDDFTEQGFEYWADSRTANASSAPRRMPAALGEHHFVQASGISMRVTLTDLDAGTVYKYRTYAKMGEQVIYGTEMSFTTTGEYKAPTYTIRFVDYDNTELLVLDVEEGTVPTYTGEEPTREEDEQYTYTFSGWTPTIVAATANATYTATYTAEEKQTSNIEDVLNAPNSDQVRKIIIEGNLYIIKNGKSYNALGAEVK